MRVHDVPDQQMVHKHNQLEPVGLVDTRLWSLPLLIQPSLYLGVPSVTKALRATV